MPGRGRVAIASERFTLEALIESKADSGGFTQIAAAAEALDQRLDRLDGRTIDLRVDLRDDLARELAALQGAISALDGRDIDIRVDVDTGAALSALATLAAAVSALDGREIDIRVDIDVAGSMAALAALQAQLAAVAAQAAALNLVLGGMGGSMRAANPAMLAAALPLLTAALYAAGVAVGLLAAAIAPLAAVLAVAAAGVGALVAIVGLVAAPFALWAANTKDANDRLKENEERQQAVKTAMDQLRSARQGLADAEERYADTQRQVNQQNRAAMDSYRDSLKAVEDQRRRLNEAERAVGDAVRQRQEGINAAVERYEETLDAVDDRQRDVRTSREQLASATNSQELAQARLVRALEDEQYILQRMRLDVAGIRLSQEESVLREAEARERLNEAMRGGDATEVQRAKLELKRIDLDQQRLNLDLRDSQRELNDSVKNGSENLRAARDEAVRAGKARAEAAEGVVRAEEALADQLKESRKAEAGIAKARREGNRLVADSVRALKGEQRGLRDAVKLTEDRWKDVRRTQREGQRQLARASKDVARQEREVAKAARAVADAAKKQRDEAGLLERAWDRLKGPVNAVFGPAITQAQILARSLERQGIQILPALGEASAKVTRGIRKGFMDAVKSVSPRERESLGAALDALGPIARNIARAIGDGAIALGDFVGQNAGRLKGIARTAADMARDIRRWFANPENRQRLSDWIRSAVPIVKALGTFFKEVVPPLVDIGIKHGPTVAKVLEGLSAIIGRAVIPALSRLLDSFVWLLDKGQQFGLWIVGLVPKILRLWEELPQKLGEIGKKIEEKLVGPFKRAFKTIFGNSIVPDLVRGVERELGTMPRRAEDALRDLPSAMERRFREGADRSSAQIDRLGRLKARGVEPDSPRWNSAMDPNRGRPGYTRAEDGSWVRSGFYGSGSGSRDSISRDEWRSMMRDSHREGARELAKVLKSAKRSGADLDDVLDSMLGGYLERKNRSGPDAR